MASAKPAPARATGVSASLDKVMGDANIGPELVKSLGDGMRNHAESPSIVALLLLFFFLLLLFFLFVFIILRIHRRFLQE